jgi:hypothetical protein
MEEHEPAILSAADPLGDEPMSELPVAGIKQQRRDHNKITREMRPKLIVIAGKRYHRSDVLAAGEFVTMRTFNKHYKLGLPFLEIGGCYYVEEAAYGRFMESRVQTNLPPQRQKARAKGRR